MLPNLKIPHLGQVFAQLQPTGGSSQLIAVHNGFFLWLALVQFEQKKPQVELCVKADAIEFTAAIGQALQTLRDDAKQQNIKLPRHVTLVSAACLPGLLDLPIEADKPRKPAEMTSMISWEMEAAIADASDLCSLGSVLEGRGHLTHQQRHEVAVELEIRRSGSSGMLSRFGETALDLGLITQDTLQESLRLQEKLLPVNTDLRCGWQVQRLVDDDTPRHLWFSSVMDVRVRSQWHKAFQKNRLKLAAIYPLHAASTSLVVAQSTELSALVVELHQEQLVCYRLQNGALESLQNMPRLIGRPLYEQCHSMLMEYMRPDINQVYLVGDVEQADSSTVGDIAGQLADSLQREVQWLPFTNSSHHALPSLIGLAVCSVATSQYKDHGGLVLPRVEAKDPAPPLWKNADFYRYGVPVLLVAAMAGHATYSVWHQDKLEDQLIELEIEMSNQGKLNKQLNAINSESQRSNSELAKLVDEAKQIVRKTQQLEQKVMARGKLLPRLLKATVASVSGKVMLDSIVEPEKKGLNSFNLHAWAVDNPSATAFTQYLQTNLLRLGYQIADPDIREGIGRYGLKGYLIELWIVPLDPNADALSSANQSAKGARG